MPFPIARQLSWQPNPDPAGGVAASYEVKVDGTIAGTPASSPLVVTFPTAKAYTVEIRAINAYGVSGPATIVEIANAPGVPVDVNIDNIT